MSAKNFITPQFLVVIHYHKNFDNTNLHKPSII
jgi:hypothetical protein